MLQNNEQELLNSFTLAIKRCGKEMSQQIVEHNTEFDILRLDMLKSMADKIAEKESEMKKIPTITISMLC